MINDPVADFLTRIRNALKAEHEMVEAPASRIKANIAKVLKQEGYIKNFRLIRVPGNKHFIRVYFKTDEVGKHALRGLKRISRPGMRVYRNKDSIPKVLGGMGTMILTTPQGVMSDRSARKENVGGELLCEVW